MGAIRVNLNNTFVIQSDYYRNLPSCDFVVFSSQFISQKIRPKLKDAYKCSLDRFNDYMLFYGLKLKTNEISREELTSFVDYLETVRGLKMSTIQGIVGKIKFLLGRAERNGWQVDSSYEDTRVISNETNSIYLSEKDIARIYYAKGLTRKQEEVRDLFIIGCATGQRYSDYSNLSGNNIRGEFIHVLQQKTKSRAVIPISGYVKEIFAKYDGVLPKARCIQYFNKSIKNICRKIGLTEEITFQEVRGGKIVMVKKQRCELISSHTARRTFVTNMVQNKFTEQAIMGCTGHKSSTCFARYNRQTLEENAKALAGNGFLR